MNLEQIRKIFKTSPEKEGLDEEEFIRVGNYILECQKEFNNYGRV